MAGHVAHAAARPAAAPRAGRSGAGADGPVAAHRSPRWHTWLLLGVVTWALSALAWASDALVVLGGDGPSYREAAYAVADELGQTAPRPHATRIVSARDLPRGLADARVVVAVGSLAAQAVAAAQPTVPVVNALLPAAAQERVARGLRSDDGRHSAVLLDQPVTRLLDLLRLALPNAGRIAVLLGPDSQAELPALTQAAAARRLRLATANVRTEKDIHAALQELLPGADVLLALPDSVVFNGNTLPHILLTAYHAHVPVVGFSPAYVTAGAMLAIYSTPSQIGRQAAGLARLALAGEPLPPPQPPRQFEVGVNGHVARSLGIAVEDELVLRDRVARAGARP